MRTPLIISLLLSLFTNYLCADMTIRYDSVSKQNKFPVHTLYIKQNLVRMDHLTGKQPDVMVNLTTGDIIQIHPENKSFFKINTHTINQYVSLYRENKGFMQSIISQGIKHLDPQKRGQIQNMLDQYEQKSSTASSISFKDTGIVNSVLGVPCRVFALLDQGQRKSDICLASYQQLELSQGDVQSFNLLKKLVHQFKQASPEQQDMLTIMANGLEELNGVPMQIVQYSANGKIRQVIQAGAISFRKVPEIAYRIPPDYQQKMTPLF